MGQKISIPNFTSKGSFTDEVKSVVHGYFKSHGISETGDWRLFSKTIILFSLFFSCYFILLFTGLSLWVKVPVLFFLGYYVIPGIGFCIMHDAIHGSYSRYAWVNYLAGLSLNFLGAINFIWKTKHNQIHHTNTNIDGFDEDIEAGSILRLHSSQTWKPIHKHQHKWWYWPTAYSLLYLLWVWVNDYKKYFTKKILYKRIKISVAEHIVFWFSKIFYLFFFAVLPITQVGFGAWFVGYIAVSLICSFRISVIFQLAHIVEGVKHPTKDEFKKSDNKEFFVHQAETTADFAVDNTFISWWVGGLNFQIEHHLFPGISHIHYPVIHRLIKPLFQKWGIEMNVKDTVRSAIRSHIRELYLLGRKTY